MVLLRMAVPLDYDAHDWQHYQETPPANWKKDVLSRRKRERDLCFPNACVIEEMAGRDSVSATSLDILRRNGSKNGH